MNREELQNLKDNINLLLKKHTSSKKVGSDIVNELIQFKELYDRGAATLSPYRDIIDILRIIKKDSEHILKVSKRLNSLPQPIALGIGYAALITGPIHNVLVHGNVLKNLEAAIADLEKFLGDKRGKRFRTEGPALAFRVNRLLAEQYGITDRRLLKEILMLLSDVLNEKNITPWIERAKKM